MISVALATHNGEKYLQNFLESLARQTQLPSELIISDDHSTDSTCELLKDFAARAPFKVTIIHNELRVGVNCNFGRAIAACNGKYIALADQDDVWFPDKLHALLKELQRPDVLAVFSDAEVVDTNLVPLGYTMWQRVRFTRREQSHLAQGGGFEVLLKHHIVTGATLAFNCDLRDVALPIPDNWPHDAWLALIAASRGGLQAIPEPLIAYRQHEGNVVGGRRKSFGFEAREALGIDRNAWYRTELAGWLTLQERLTAISAQPLALAALVDKLAHLKARADLPFRRWCRVPGVMRELVSGRYARHARNWGSIAIDLLVR